MAVQPIPRGHHSVTPLLSVKGAARLVGFLKQAFGATETSPAMTSPDGAVMHAELKIGDSLVMLGEAHGEPAPGVLYLYVPDADATYQRALQAGAASINAPTNQFWGDRTASIKDPCGTTWWIATHIEDVAPEEMTRRAEAAMKQHTSGSGA